MKHTYRITGMTCNSCVAKVKSLLENVPGINSAEVNLENRTANLTMEKHVAISELQDKLAPTKYSIEEIREIAINPKQSKGILNTYKPIFLIFGYILTVTLLIQIVHHHFDLSQWMRHFMSGFFLVFSFFKLLDLKAFAEGYQSYDIVAKRFLAYGFLYPFIELGLGLCFLLPGFSFYTNLITLIVMAVSIIGVIQSVIQKKEIECACLGTIFKLPLSTVTLFEDSLMIAMSALGLMMS